MKTIGLYLANAFGISWNAKKDKDGKVTEASVTYDFDREVMLSQIKLNGHTWESVGQDYALKKLERSVKGLKDDDDELIVTRDSSKKEVEAAMLSVAVEIRTPDVETISVAQFMIDNGDKLKALGIKEAQVRGFISMTMPHVVITD
jgi:hypothetical protein